MQGLVASSAKVVGHARKGFTPAEPLPDKPCKSVFRVTAMPVGRPPVIVAETGPEPRPFKDLALDLDEVADACAWRRYNRMLADFVTRRPFLSERAGPIRLLLGIIFNTLFSSSRSMLP